MQSLVAFVCDGACVRQGTPRAKAAWAFGRLDDERNLIRNSIRSGLIAGDKQTNNVAELTAIEKTIAAAPRDAPVIIYSDSYYSINALTQWWRKWEKNGWKASSNEPVKNKELIQKILAMLKAKSLITFRHIAGHSGHLGKIHVAHDIIDQTANGLVAR